MHGTCEVSVQMLREWVAGREDVIAYIGEFTEAHTVVGYQRKVEEAFEGVTASFVALAIQFAAERELWSRRLSCGAARWRRGRLLRPEVSAACCGRFPGSSLCVVCR